MLNKNIKFSYSTYMEGNLCTTKVYMDIASSYGTEAEKIFNVAFMEQCRKDSDMIDKNRKNQSKWDGSHWDSPIVFASEQIEDMQMSEDMEKLIEFLDAEPISEDEDDEELSSDELNEAMKYILLKDYFEII